MRSPSVGWVVGLALSAACCTSQAAEVTSTTTILPSAPIPSTTAVIESIPTVPNQPEAPLEGPSLETPADLLTFANGAVVASVSGLGRSGTAAALRMIDGSPDAKETSATGLVEVIFLLPAETEFNLFSVPNVNDPPGRATFFRHIEIAGSIEGPDQGYEVLATTELKPQGQADVTELVPNAIVPVRWIRLRLEHGINVPEGDEATLGFSELIGTGSQAEIPLVDDFAGLWKLQLAERPDERGQQMEIIQDGTTITGCVGNTALNGTVNGSIARLTGTNQSGTPTAYIFVPDGTGGLQGVVSAGDGVFGARVATRDPQGEAPPCSVPVPEVVTCGAVVYVNFAIDSDQIKPESRAVLADLFDRVRREGIGHLTIEGHTSTEADDEYNRDLSERRAAAVADDLIRRGLDPSTISVVGKGETEPLISPELDEAARSINRRVEILCD